MLLVGLSMTIFIGCVREYDASFAPFDPNKTYDLTFGVFGDLERAYSDVIASAEFRAAFPNINITFITADFNGHHSRLTTVIAAQERTSDIEALEVVYIAQFVEGGGLRNFNMPAFDGQTVVQDLVPFAVSNGQTAEGQIVAIPVDVAPAVLFYREDIVKASGVDPQEIQNLRDWDHYIEIGRKLTIDFDNDGKVDQFVLPHANDAALIPLNGGKSGWFNAQNAPFEPKDRFITSLELVKKIRSAGIDGDIGAWSPPWVKSFSSGKVATTVMGAWFGGALKTWIAPDVTDWRVAYLPGRFPASSGGTYLTIPRTVPAENVAAAWEVIKYFTTNENSQLSVFRAIDAFPALQSVYDNPIMEEGVGYFGGQKARLIFADAAKQIPSSNVHPNDFITSTMFGGAVGEVLLDDAGIEEAYERAKLNLLATIQ